jgi:hypothetical protein
MTPADKAGALPSQGRQSTTRTCGPVGTTGSAPAARDAPGRLRQGGTGKSSDRSSRRRSIPRSSRGDPRPLSVASFAPKPRASATPLPDRLPVREIRADPSSAANELHRGVDSVVVPLTRPAATSRGLGILRNVERLPQLAMPRHPVAVCRGIVTLWQWCTSGSIRTTHHIVPDDLTPMLKPLLDVSAVEAYS